MTVISYVDRLKELAQAAPDGAAVTMGSTTVTWTELDERSDVLARVLLERGVQVGDMVSMILSNGPDWFVTVVAVWKVGGTPQPLNARMPDREVTAVLELAEPRVVVTTDPDRLADWATVSPADLPDDPELPLPPVVSPAWKAPTSGGSTGRPKLIVSGDPAEMEADAPLGATLGIPPGGCLIMPGPMYHNGPIVWSVAALLSGAHVVLLERFDPERTLAAVQEHHGDVIYLVPTMMRRIWKLPAEVRDAYDLSSLKIVWHLAEPCPPWLKHAWIEWLGPERIVELYAGTEGQLSCVISGVEWLEHEGSVGRPLGGEISIRDPEGNEVPVGEPGEVWMRSARPTPGYRYVGAEARRSDDQEWESLGDMGHVDAEGYLYLGDRTADMILVGGANVYPAEVEGALGEHAQVRSCAVIGLPDEDKGNRVHAIVEADPSTVTAEELLAFAAERLSIYKVPRTVEFVDEPLRDDAGKVRRAALRAERLP